MPGRDQDSCFVQANQGERIHIQDREEVSFETVMGSGTRRPRRRAWGRGGHGSTGAAYPSHFTPASCFLTQAKSPAVSPLGYSRKRSFPRAPTARSSACAVPSKRRA